MNKFGHIGIYVRDMEKSIKFYTDLLDCKIVKEYEYPEMRLVFLDAGGTHIELIYKSSNEERNYPGPIDHLAFKVESLDKKIKMLNEHRIEIIGEPRIVGSSRIIFFKGINNERFEFVERYNG
ncbi:MAG: VOC family protein [Clostridiales bacterium]|nr:VOC family protein [Clostridiales bacterium]